MDQQTQQPPMSHSFRVGCSDAQGRVPAGHGMAPADTCMALSGNIPIPTPDGWTRLDQIKPGQEVFDHEGNPCLVQSVCHRRPEPVFRVDFDDESCLLAGAGQPWVTLTHPLRLSIHRQTFPLQEWSGRFFPYTTAEMQGTLIHRRKSLVASMHSVPLGGPLTLADQDLPFDPYLLGLWLGDGTSGGPYITSHHDDEPHYRKRALAAGENWRVTSRKDNVLTCSMARGPRPLLIHRLRQLGVVNNKHIPLSYLRAGFDQRLELLKGLMDSDGTVGLDRAAVEFTSISASLSDGVLELALTLGQKATRRQGDAMLYGRRISDKWRVAFTPTMVVFSLPREVNRLEDCRQRRGQVPLTRVVQRYVRAVTEAGMAPTVCIVVASPRKMFLAGHSMIPVRSSGVVGRA